MPYYDVKCNNCKKLYEDVKLNYEDLDKYKCKKCGGSTSRHWGKNGSMGIVFKCGGFSEGYATTKKKNKD